MQIPLQDLHPNPYRDFDLHPIDPVQVERLKASLDADGFWASVVARKVADGYQIAFGHHRIEAARALGLEAAPIEVRELSDWQMARMLASENATQRGSTAAACLDAVAAIARVLVYDLLDGTRRPSAKFRRRSWWTTPRVGVALRRALVSVAIASKLSRPMAHSQYPRSKPPSPP